jgi:hypothetical protein
MSKLNVPAGFAKAADLLVVLQAGIDDAQRVLDDLARTGISLDAVTDELIEESVQLFADADELLGALAKKRTALLGNRLDMQPGHELKTAVKDAIRHRSGDRSRDVIDGEIERCVLNRR